jgi:sterol desaturase/sphingolipid hydroxylase (fatty acid hydroxylase superfamily)
MWNWCWNIFWVGSVFFAFETLFPHESYTTYSRIRGYFFWTINIFITAVGMTVFSSLFRKFGLHPLMIIKPYEFLDSGIYIINPIELTVSYILSTSGSMFFYYWFHRFQHSSAFLWRFHQVHHSLREMSALNCNHHFTEEFFRIPFIFLPSSLLIQMDPGPTPWIIATLFGMQSLFEHSCTRLNLGVFRYVVSDNRFHRIHHSIERQHWNTNFGSFTPIWDIVFGTAHFPGAEEWPETGVEGMEEPATVKELLLGPFLPASPSSVTALAESTNR